VRIPLRGKSLEGKTTKGVPDSFVGETPETCSAAVEYTIQAAALPPSIFVRTEASLTATIFQHSSSARAKMAWRSISSWDPNWRAPLPGNVRI
jgi:hypothetical protein